MSDFDPADLFDPRADPDEPLTSPRSFPGDDADTAIRMTRAQAPGMLTARGLPAYVPDVSVAEPGRIIAWHVRHYMPDLTHEPPAG
jgi:hypothetical protein